LFSPQHPKTVISTEGGALAAAVEKSAVVFAVVCFFCPAPQKLSFRPKAAHLPPQWRNLLLSLPLSVFLPSTQKLSFRPEAAHLPPQWRNLLFARSNSI
jgi:hypothetical protein